MEYELPDKIKIIFITVIVLLAAAFSSIAFNQSKPVSDQRNSIDKINQTAIQKALKKMENEAQGRVKDTRTVSVKEVRVDGNSYYNWTVGWNVEANTGGKWATSSNTSEWKMQTYLLSRDGEYIYYPPFHSDKVSEGLQEQPRESVRRKVLEKIEKVSFDRVVRNTSLTVFEKVRREGNKYYLVEASFQVEPNDYAKWGTEQTTKMSTRYLTTLDGDHIFLLPWHTGTMSYKQNRTEKLEERLENVIVDFSRNGNMIVRFGDRITKGKILNSLERIEN